MSEQTWYVVGGVVLAILILRAISVKKAGGPSGLLQPRQPRAPRQPKMPGVERSSVMASPVSVPDSPSKPRMQVPLGNVPLTSEHPVMLKNMEDVQRLVTKGDYIGAIKVFYTQNKTGLKEAKDFIEALRDGKISINSLQTGQAAQVGGAIQGAVSPTGVDLQQQVLQMVQNGQTINAIKMVREKTGMGLKEAKDYVDQVILESGR